MTLIKAAKQALEALEFDGFMPEDLTHRSLHAKAIATIKQALALEKMAENARELGLDYEPAPVQEPLEYWNAVEGWVKIDEVREHFDTVGCGTIYKNAGDGRVPLTAAQRQWVGLTDDDIHQLRREGAHEVSDKDFKAIEAKLKEKNT